MAWIDWAASARLSAARGTDEFVVREYLAQEAPRAAIVVDRRPSLGLFGPESPWLDKPRGGPGRRRGDRGERRRCARRGRLPRPRGAGRAAASGCRRRGAAASRTSGPGSPARASRRRRARSSSGLQALLRHGHVLPPGSFVFVLSDFLAPVRAGEWARLRGAPLGRRPGDRPGPDLGTALSRTSTAPLSRSPIPQPESSRRRGSRGARCRRSRSSTSSGSTARCGRSTTSAATPSSSAAKTHSRPLAAWAARRRALTPAGGMKLLVAAALALATRRPGGGGRPRGASSAMRSSSTRPTQARSIASRTVGSPASRTPVRESGRLRGRRHRQGAAARHGEGGGGAAAGLPARHHDAGSRARTGSRTSSSSPALPCSRSARRLWPSRRFEQGTARHRSTASCVRSASCASPPSVPRPTAGAHSTISRRRSATRRPPSGRPGSRGRGRSRSRSRRSQSRRRSGGDADPVRRARRGRRPDETDARAARCCSAPQQSAQPSRSFWSAAAKPRPRARSRPATDGLVVLDLSASISTDTYARIGATLDELADTGGRYGLIVFSDTAYLALPPGTPAAELRAVRTPLRPPRADRRRTHACRPARGPTRSAPGRRSRPGCSWRWTRSRRSGSGVRPCSSSATSTTTSAISSA